MVDERRIDAPVRRAVFLVVAKDEDEYVFVRQPSGDLLIALCLDIRDLRIQYFPLLLVRRPYRLIQAVDC